MEKARPVRGTRSRVVLVLSYVLLGTAISSTAHSDLLPEEAQFLSRHWPQQLPSAGIAAASLEAAACGRCHVQQYESWRKSLHSRSTQAGLPVLVKTMGLADKAEVCLICHAPLKEQLEGVAQWLGNSTSAAPTDEGVTCAVCHVRAGAHVGPPRREGLIVKSSTPMHAGFTVETAFEKAEFCGACHEYDGARHLGDEADKHTLTEWKASSFSTAGAQCQTCHMPNREHSWKGIHDPDMVRRALELRVEPVDSEHGVAARIHVRNTGAGHYLPTYSSARIRVTAVLLDGRGEALSATQHEYEIGRAMDLAAMGVSASERVLSDSRIAPLAERSFDYHIAQASGAESLRVDVLVEPQYLLERVFSALPTSDAIAAHLARIRATRYELLHRVVPLTPHKDGSA